MCQEHAFVLAVEKLLGIECRRAGNNSRPLREISRILNHLLNVTTLALDVGAMTPTAWAFEEREKLMEFYERAVGRALHAAYFRVWRRPSGFRPAWEMISAWCGSVSRSPR